MSGLGVDEPTRLAALVFAEGEAANRLVADFAGALARRGHRIGGVIQVTAAAGACDCRETLVRDLETGSELPILQDLGRHSESCRIDTAALAAVGHLISRAIVRRPDLLFINRFGKLEAGGKGILPEIGAAAVSGIPTLVAVSTRYIEPWRRFTMGLDRELSCSSADLEAWWEDVTAMRSLTT